MVLTGSAFNLVLFLIITILYYSFKKNPSLEDVNSPELKSSQNKATIIYFILVLLTQFAINASVLSSMCGESGVSRNVIGQAAFYTIIPWTFFFGIVILVLYVFPNFKSAFSDVVGYFYVSKDANNILVTLLKNQGSPEITARVFGENNNEGKGVDISVPDKINFSDKNPDFETGLEKQLFQFDKPASEMNFGANLNHTIKVLQERLNISEAKGVDTASSPKEITDASANDLIMKICGNSGILINQMSPTNFESYWNTLSSLFKDKYKNSSAGNVLKQQLFELVVTRDNIGESMWFAYTGFLVTSIVQFQMASSSCKK
jgi:hypothetical protein